jgi:hypothetical protein
MTRRTTRFAGKPSYLVRTAAAVGSQRPLSTPAQQFALLLGSCLSGQLRLRRLPGSRCRAAGSGSCAYNQPGHL